MLLVLLATALATTSPAEATLEVGRCVLELRVDGRVVASGRERCNNPEARRVRIRIPQCGAALIEVKEHVHYANGGIWVVHDSRVLAPLRANEVYGVHEQDLAVVGGAQGDLPAHCVRVTADPRIRDWSITSYGDSFGPFVPGRAASTGGKLRRHTLVLRLATGGALSIPYVRGHDGLYTFTLGRKVDALNNIADVHLSFADAQSCP